MMIRDEIIQMLEEAKRVPALVKETSNLYTDLAFDSLSFVNFLVKVEKRFSVSFELTEMVECLQADRMIALVEEKTKAAEAEA